MTNYTPCSPRKIKKIERKSLLTNEDKNTLKYEFYRLLVEPSIIRLNNEKEKINCSQWLTRIDSENSDLKLHLIQILFISLQNNRTYYVFLNPPPEDLSELNLFEEENTMDMVKNIQVITNNIYANEEILQEIEYKRSAAVATDMCSYSAVKISKHMVQSFYVRSDFPIQMWYNPSDIVLPHSFDHNEWEQYLNRFDIATKSTNIDDDKHRNTCESIFNVDQVSKELDSECIFRWHPHSKLYNKDRPKRLAAFLDVDADISNQPFLQQQIDESAFNIVHNKSFPGYKILNPKHYSTILMPDPKFVFNMTGVKIIHNKIPHASFNNNGQENRLEESYEERIPKANGSTRKQDIVSEVSCTNSERSSTNSTCTLKSATQELWCSTTTTTQNSDDNVQESCTDSNTRKRINSDKNDNNCRLVQQNNTYRGCDSEPSVDSKCAYKSLRSEWCQTESQIGTNKVRNVCESENRECSEQTKSSNNDDIRSEIRNTKYLETSNANNDESNIPGSRPPAWRNTCNGLLETTSKRDERNSLQVGGKTEKPSDYRCQGRSMVSGPACDDNSEPAEVVGGYAEFVNDPDDCRRTSSEDGLSTRPDDKAADNEFANDRDDCRRTSSEDGLSTRPDDRTADDDDDMSNWSDEFAWPPSGDKARSCDSLTTLTSDPSDSFCSSAEDDDDDDDYYDHADGRWPVFESSSALSDRSDYTNAGIPCPFDGSCGRENDVWEDDDDPNEEDCLENVNMSEYTSLEESRSSSDMSRIAESVEDVRRCDGFDSPDIDGRSEDDGRRFQNAYDQ